MTEATFRNRSVFFPLLTVLGAAAAAAIVLAPPKFSLVFLFISTIAIVTILRPSWGLSFLVALIPFEGLLVQSPVLSFMKGYGIFLALASLPVLFKKSLRELLPGRPLLLYLAFVVWSLLSLAWAHDTEPAITKNFTYVSLLVFYLLIFYLPERGSETRHLKAFVLGSLLSILSIPLMEAELDSASSRMAGGGLNANDYAAVLAIAMPLALMWLNTEKKMWMKIIPLIFLPVGLLAIAYTKSRTGTLALIPFAIYGFMLFKQRGLLKKFALAAVSLATIFIVMYFLPPGYIERIKALDVDSSERFTHRLDVWVAGKNMFIDNPVMGVGTGNFPLLSREYAETYLGEGSLVAHNAFISVAGELGGIGVSLFVLLMYHHLKQCLSMARGRENSNTRTFALGLATALATYIMASMGLTLEYRKVLPVVLGSIALLSRLREDEQA